MRLVRITVAESFSASRILGVLPKLAQRCVHFALQSALYLAPMDMAASRSSVRSGLRYPESANITCKERRWDKDLAHAVHAALTLPGGSERVVSSAGQITTSEEGGFTAEAVPRSGAWKRHPTWRCRNLQTGAPDPFCCSPQPPRSWLEARPPLRQLTEI